MIFNKTKYNNLSFQLDGHPLEIVQSYNYLGLKICSSGSFTSAIKELSCKALRAYHAMRSTFLGTPLQPRIYMKLFDCLVKPIALYGCEVWGAFGYKTSNISTLPETLLTKDKLPYKTLHLKASKHILQVSKSATNIAVRAELGRLPLMFNIICAISKYRARLESFKDDDLLYHALKSQKSLHSNSYKTATYDKFADQLLKNLDIPACPVANIKTLKTDLNNFVLPIKRKCKEVYLDIFKNLMANLQNNEETKLTIYSHVKSKYAYEPYLNIDPFHGIITKFRMSNHNLPIERGRYAVPKLPRNERLCTFCKSHIGDELHVLFKCKNPSIGNVNQKYLDLIKNICNQFAKLSDESKLQYILKAIDKDILKITGKWLTEINILFKCK